LQAQIAVAKRDGGGSSGSALGEKLGKILRWLEKKFSSEGALK